MAAPPPEQPSRKQRNWDAKYEKVEGIIKGLNQNITEEFTKTQNLILAYQAKVDQLKKELAAKDAECEEKTRDTIQPGVLEECEAEKKEIQRKLEEAESTLESYEQELDALHKLAIQLHGENKKFRSEYDKWIGHESISDANLPAMAQNNVADNYVTGGRRGKKGRSKSPRRRKARSPRRRRR